MNPHSPDSGLMPVVADFQGRLSQVHSASSSNHSDLVSKASFADGLPQLPPIHRLTKQSH